MDEQQAERIATGLREGNAEAWHALYDAYAVPVWRSIARLMGPSSADVADVVQETFLAAARSARTYDAQRGSLWLWLCGIARLQVALHYRKQSRRHRLQVELEAHCTRDGVLQGRPQAGAPLPTDAVSLAELARLVRSTLVELPEDYATLLTAKYLDDVSVDDLANQARSTPVAIRSKLARAREAFRKLFAERWPGAVEEGK